MEWWVVRVPYHHPIVLPFPLVPCPFQGGTPSPSHNSSTGLRSLQGYSHPVLMGGMPIQSWWGRYSPSGLDGSTLSPSTPIGAGWGYPPVRDWMGVPPMWDWIALLPRTVRLLRFPAGGLSWLLDIYLILLDISWCFACDDVGCV